MNLIQKVLTSIVDNETLYKQISENDMKYKFWYFKYMFQFSRGAKMFSADYNHKPFYVRQ